MMDSYSAKYHAGSAFSPVLISLLLVKCAPSHSQVKFVDLSKLPKKYKQSYSLDALRQQRQQQQQKAIELEQQQQQQEQEEQQQQLEQGKVPQRWWQQQSKRQQLARSLPAQVLDKLPPGGRVLKVDMGTPEAAAAAAAGAAAGAAGMAAGSDWADGSSSSSRVQPLYDLDSTSSSSSGGGGGGDWADDILGAAGVANGSSFSRGGGGDTFQSSGAGQYEAEFRDLAQSPSAAAAAAAGGGEEGDFRAVLQSQQQQQQGQDEGSEAEEVAADPDFVLDESKLQQLVDSARSEGLDVSRALAEAVAFGVQIDATAAAAVGVELPPPDAVEAAREGIVAAIREMQEQDQESSAAAAAAAAAAAEGGQDAEEVQVGSSSSRGGRSRTWGAGLTAAVQRAKARKEQQQQ